MIELIGAYNVHKEPNVSLLEFLIHAKHNEFDIGKITQVQSGIAPLD